jgi:IMP dehydrogenase
VARPCVLACIAAAGRDRDHVAYGGGRVRIVDGVSRSLNEYLLIPGLTAEDCTTGNVDLSTSLARHPPGGRGVLRIALPVVSAIMEAVSSPRLAIALAQAGGIGFIHQNQPVAEQAADIRSVKRFPVKSAW